MHLEECWLEGDFSCCGPMFYTCLFGKKFGTGNGKLRPEEVPIINLKYRGRIFNSNNSSDVNYKQKDESSICFGSLLSFFLLLVIYM